MARAKIIVALVVGLSPLTSGCSFVRDLAIDAFIPEARPLIDSLRKQAEPQPEPETVPLPALPPAPVIEPLPEPTPPPKVDTVLSPEDEAARRAIELYENRMDELRRQIERKLTTSP